MDPDPASQKILDSGFDLIKFPFPDPYCSSGPVPIINGKSCQITQFFFKIQVTIQNPVQQ
jgi:hypothetical protein